MSAGDLGAGEGVSQVFADDDLLLIAHGSVRFADAGCVLRDQVRRIEDAGIFRQVVMGLLNGEPAVAASLTRLTAPVVRVVPFFMEDGYFTRVAVPHALGAGDGLRRLVLCPPVGVHEGMAGLIERHVRHGCALRGLHPAATAVLIVGHGSARAPGRALALHRHAAQVAAGGMFAHVTAACLEETPLVADALRELRGQAVAVVGFFAGAGGHVREDVPGLIAAEQAARGAAGRDVHDFGSIAAAPAMMRIILDQARAG